MKNRNVINFKKNDEYYTPKYVVEIIVPFLKENNIKNILCPADKKESYFVKILKENNFKTYFSHLEDIDFLKYENFNHQKGTINFVGEEVKIDLIVTNPPFSLKMEFIKKANELGIPYLFLLGLHILNYKNIAEQMKADESSLIYLVGSKISFDGNPSSFQCSYFTNFIKNKIIYIELKNEKG